MKKTPWGIHPRNKCTKTPQIFTQGPSVQNFSQIQPFLRSPGCPKAFQPKLAYFGWKNWSPGPKNQNFWKMKKKKNTPRYSKMVRFGWNLAQLFLGWISGGVFFIFQKFWSLGPGDEFFAKTRLKLWGSLEASKMVRFDWNFPGRDF